MPLHSFYCFNCKNKWEDLLKMNEHDNMIQKLLNHTYLCPKCKSNEIVRNIDLSNFVLNGKPGSSGFYKLDYQKESK